MKRIACIIMTLVLLVSLAACEGITINVNIGGTPADTTEAVLPEDTAPSTPPTTQPEEPVVPEDTQPQSMTHPTTPAQTTMTVDALWDMLSGCWVGDEDRFVYFTYNDQGPAFWSGVWENPIPYRREAAAVSALNDLGGGLYTMNLTYPIVSGDAADSQDLMELRYTLMLDISDLSHGTITVEAPDDTLRQYTFGGYSYDDAYDASNNVQYATFAEMQEFWRWLTGYWNSEDGKFICFDQKDSNSLVFMQGIWNSGSRGWADFEKAMSGYMDLPMEFVVYYPPVSNELDGDLPYEYVVVSVDWMEVETHGRIYVQIGENGDWVQYTFAGFSESDAYPN